MPARPDRTRGVSQTDVGLRSVAARLHRLRTDAGISQSELARWSGVHQASISAYELGLKTPTLPSLVKYGVVFRMSVSEILAGVI